MATLPLHARALAGEPASVSAQVIGAWRGLAGVGSDAQGRSMTASMAGGGRGAAWAPSSSHAQPQPQALGGHSENWTSDGRKAWAAQQCI